MGSNLLYPPAKRPIQTPDPMANGLSNKRSKHSKTPPTESRQPLPIPEGHVVFRLLCHSSRTGGIIGKSGTIIKQLQQQTGSKIRIEEAPADSPDRAITIIGPSVMNSKIEDVEVSKAQEGLVRVFERILEVAAETDGISVTGVVSCRLLAEKKQAGSVIGKGGKVIEKIRKDFGVKIKVLNDKLPVCALPLEEMIEIEGNVLSVKKALIATSRCIQDSQPVDKLRIAASKPVEAVPQERLPVMPTVENLIQRNPMLPSMPSGAASYVPISHHFPIEPSRVPSLNTKSLQKEVLFKILCSNDTVGGVIGKGGAVIKALQAESGASVTIGASVDDCDEQVITVTASESPESRYSAAQKAVVLVFSRSFGSATEKGLDPSSAKGFPFAARLTVPSNQVGCLLGKGGAIISEMRKTTGANIKILGRDQLPKCVSENEQVVQISGDFTKVKDALYHVTGRLRDNLFSTALSTPVPRNTASLTEASPYGRLREPLREPWRELLRDPFMEPLRDPLRDPLMEPLREPLGDVFRDPYTRVDSLIRGSSGDALRDSLTDPLRGPTPYNLHSPVGVSVGLNRHSMLTHSMDHLGLSHGIDRPPSPRSWAPQTMAGANPREIADANRELGSFNSGSELGSVCKSAIVTNTTVEIRVPENVIGSVYGENGNNLTRLRQISGAKVIVHEPRIGSSDRIIVISGTPDETQAAQSLLQAFILTGQS